MFVAYIQGNSVRRMLIALVVNACVFLCCVVFTLVKEVDAYLFFYLNCAMVALCGVSTAFLQNGKNCG